MTPGARRDTRRRARRLPVGGRRLPGSPLGATVPACFAWGGRARGTTTLSFIHRRHWEIQADGVLRYDLAVSVTSGK